MKKVYTEAYMSKRLQHFFKCNNGDLHQWALQRWVYANALMRVKRFSGEVWFKDDKYYVA